MYLQRSTFCAVGAAFVFCLAAAKGSASEATLDITRIPSNAPAWLGNTYIVRGDVDVAVGDILQNIRNAFPRTNVRVYAPAELMALTGFSPLVVQRVVATWLVVLPLDNDGSVLWVRLSGNQTGLTLRYGVVYRSRLAYYRATMRRVTAGVLAAQWLPDSFGWANALPFTTGNVQILRDSYTFDTPLRGGLLR